MAGWTKEQFDNDYIINAEWWGHPASRPGVKLHYNWGVMYPYISARWSHLIPYLNITASDVVLIVGCAFGWSNEYLEEQLPGITSVGVDISDYIHSVKDIDETVDIEASIQAAGEDPLSEAGQRILSTYSRSGARSKSIVINEDAKTNQSRNQIRQALGNQWPTKIYTEDLVQDMTDTELQTLVADYANIPVPIVHIIGDEATRTAENVNAVTGQRCVYVEYGRGVLKDVS